MALPPPPQHRWPAWLQGLAIALSPERYPDWLLRRFAGETMAAMRAPAFGDVVSVTDPGAIRALAGCPAGVANARVLPLFGDRSVILADGDEHLALRRALSPPLHGTAIARHRETVAAVAAAEVATWPVGATIALLPRMRAVTLDVALRAVLGSEDPRLRRALERTLSVNPLLVVLEGRRPVLGRLRVLPWVRARRDAQALLAVEIAARRAAGATGDDVLSHLLATTDLDDRAVGDQLLTLLLAGHDTTAAALAWCVERLLHHPGALARARDDDAFLRAAIDETLRVRPVLDVAWRRPAEDVEAGGHTIPAGTLVMLGIRGAHRLPAHYGDDAAAWRPERERPATAFLPFGAGPRRCLGAAFAQMELHQVLRTVLDAVDLAPVSRRPERQTRLRTITTVPARGARARVVSGRGPRS